MVPNNDIGPANPTTSPTMTSDDAIANTRTFRLVSAMSYTVSPCSSGELVTDELANIEEKYYVNPHVLGAGHHGSVRECIDRSTGQRYAVKSIRKNDPAVKPGIIAREIDLLQAMDHENIVKLVDLYEDPDYIHLVTDLCEGGELFDKIIENSSKDDGNACFQEDEAARIVHQILEAVLYLHRKGVAHRDIKPENILFESANEDSRVKLIDFGLSQKHFSIEDPPMNAVVGTPYYIAPEVLKRRYNKSCDLWSIGVICYVLLCGYPPFNGPNNEATYRAVRRGRYCFYCEDWEGVSREAMDFIQQLLQMDVQRRMTVDQALRHPWILNHVNRY